MIFFFLIFYAIQCVQLVSFPRLPFQFNQSFIRTGFGITKSFKDFASSRYLIEILITKPDPNCRAFFLQDRFLLDFRCFLFHFLLIFIFSRFILHFDALIDFLIDQRQMNPFNGKLFKKEKKETRIGFRISDA